MNQNQNNPNLAKELAGALEAQVKQATGILSAELAELRASAKRDVEASERKRRKLEDLTKCKNRKWLTARANNTVACAITQQYDLGYVQEQLASVQALLTPPPAAAALDRGDEAPTDGQLMSVTDQ